MKILYISSGYPWPHNNLDYGIINGLLKLNQAVVAIDPREIDDRIFFETLEQFNPDFILTLHGKNLDINKLTEIKKRGYKTGVWLIDDPYEIDSSIVYAIYYDYIFNTERYVIDMYKKYVKITYYIPLGSNEEVFKRIPDSRYASDICIIGSAFKNRLDLIDDIYEELIKYDIKIIGRWWEKLKHYDAVKSKVVSRIITDEDAAKCYSNTKINLNIHKSYDDETINANKKKTSCHFSTQ